MTRYLVFEPPEAIGPSGEAVFVRDRFSFFAFLFTFLWMFRYGLWLAGLATIVILVAINLLGAVQGFEVSALLISLLFGVLVGLEGPSLRASKLRRKGWNDVAAFEARDVDEAEIIYYHAAPIVALPPYTAETVEPEPDDIEPAEPAGVERPAAPAPEMDETNLTSPAPAPIQEERDEVETKPHTDPGTRLAAEIERTAKVEGWAERWDRPGAEPTPLSGSRRKPVGRL